MTRRYVSERGKTSRAFRAYVDLMDTADSLRDRMSRHLEVFDLTMLQFRVLQAVFHDGPMYQQAISRKFRCTKQNVSAVIDRMEQSGWISRESATLPRRDSAIAKAPAGAATGRKIVLVQLTPQGKQLIARVFPKHAKVVKAEMKMLEGREQQTLSRLCQKLRKRDVMKWFKEITMEEMEER
jgi:MarR family transcriptional regulator, 2-MHQ and catechol-resistance regulon repressor